MRVLFHVFAALPLAVVQGLGDLVGWLMWVLSDSRKQVALTNIGRCMPELSAPEQRRVARRSIAHEVKTYVETPLYWLAGERRAKGFVKEWRGLDIYDRALALGKGVILLTLHMGAFEAVAIPMSARYRLTGLYKPQKGVINDLSIQGRGRFGGQLVPTEAGVRKSLLPILARGEGVYFMPDHDPPEGRGVFAPFLGIEAHTPSLVGKLVRESGAPVVFMFGERLPWGRGYVAHFLEAPRGMDDANPKAAAAAMNRGLEACVRACPEQYWWGYKRFRRRPPGEPRFYD